MQPEFHIGAVTRPLSAYLWLAMMGCPALRAREELAAGACAPVLGWNRSGSSSAGAHAWWGAWLVERGISFESARSRVRDPAGALMP